MQKKGSIYLIFLLGLIASVGAVSEAEEQPPPIGGNDCMLGFCAKVDSCITRFGVYDLATNNYYYSSGGGYGKMDMLEDWYNYYEDWLFSTFATKDDLAELYDYVEMLYSGGDELKQAMLKANRLNVVVLLDNYHCYPRFGCVKIVG